MSGKNVALAPSPDGRAVEVDRTINAPPASLTGTVVGMLDALKNSLTSMDDMSCEIALHSDQARSSAHIKVRAYRRAPRE
jgi:hypothetical protein